MNTEQKDKLRELARNSIALELGIEISSFDENDFKDSIFHEKRGVFVTLEIGGQLRGCIGNIDPVYPLYKAVQRNAREAAFSDRRFDPVEEEELENIDIEISVLTVPKKLEFDSSGDLLSKLRPGIDGVVLKNGSQGATYLPQVWEDLPDKEMFLSTLALKAGLSTDDWQECEVYIYEVEKF